MTTKHPAVRLLLSIVHKQHSKYELGVGICSNLEDCTTSMASEAIIEHMNRWPEHSGHDASFPVPSMTPISASDAYQGSLYGHTPYGDKRRELAAWLLAEIENGNLLL